MLAQLKIAFFLAAFSFFNITVSMIAYSLISSEVTAEKQSFVIEARTLNPAMTEDYVSAHPALPLIPDLPPALPAPGEHSGPGIPFIPQELLESLLGDALKHVQPDLMDKSSLDEQGVFASPGPKKNLI